jgi:lysozyme family protein
MRLFVALIGFAFLAAVSAAPAAGTEADFKAALTAALAAENDAGALKNQWTTTEQVLDAAKKAAAAGDFDTAVREARHAEALARASIAQAREQEGAWRAGVIR